MLKRLVKRTENLFAEKFGSLKISITFAAAFRGKDLKKGTGINKLDKNQLHVSNRFQISKEYREIKQKTFSKSLAV